MISANKRFMYGEAYNDIRCLSTDVKPVDGVKNGSVLVEIDTGNRYMFDAEFKEWNEMPTGGGGGGGSATAGVDSFNGRRGAVRSRSGDYTASQISTATAGKSVQDALDDMTTDSALSSTSSHPVENRAIKAKFDEIEASMQADSALSPSSAKPVRNSVITAKFSELESEMQPDAVLSTTSEKTVQNKVVTRRLNEIEASVQVDATLSPTSQRPVRNSAISAKFAEHEGKLVPAGGAAGAVLAKTTGADHALEWKSADEWMLKDDYDADDDGVVDEAELADAVKTGLHNATAPDKGRDVTLMTDADKGIANGIVPLDSGRKILPEYLPDSIMAGLTYGGVFDASTRVVELTPAAKSILDVSADTMTLENSSQIPEGYPANAELFYITTVGGSFAGMTFAAGDWLISLSTSWKQLQSGNQVSSVNAQTGAVVLDSDDIAQGAVNLYMRTTERAKLADIEARATRDVNVIQSAAIMTDADDNDFLRLTNKNGATTDFYGGSVDLTDYLRKDGNASNVYAPYTPASSRVAFTGSETLAQLVSKVTGWLNAVQDVAFTRDYDDLTDKPTYNGVTLQGNVLASTLGTLDVRKVSSLPSVRSANTMYVVVDSSTTPPTTDFWVQLDTLYHIETGGVEDYDDLANRPTYNSVTMEGALTAFKLGTLDVREVSELPLTPTRNTLYVYNTTKRGQPWTRYFVYTNDWNEIETGGFEVIGVNNNPTSVPPTSDAIYVHRWTGADSVGYVQVGIMLNGVYERIALHSNVEEDYLKKDGDASDVYALYSPDETRDAFTGSETLADFAAKVTGWLSDIERVAFTGDYDDLDNRPTYNGVTLEGEMAASDLGTLDVSEVTELPAEPTANTMYIFHTTKRDEPWTRYFVYTDDWCEIETGGFEVIDIDTDPETTPPTGDAIYVHRWTDAGTDHTQVGIMLDGTYERLALHSDILTDYDELDGKPRIDAHELVSGNQTHESLGLVGKADFVATPTGKARGIEIVLEDATPADPIVVTEINDSAEMKYSTVHTSSNHYINNQLDALNMALAGKLNLLFVAELPDPPTRNTQYYVETSESGVYDIVIVDSVGTQHSAGTTEIDLGGLVRDTREVAGIALDADISASQMANAIKAETVTLTNKTINADSNTVSNIETDNLKSSALATSIGGTPTDTRLATEKCVSDYAVPKTTGTSKVYGTDGGGATKYYSLSTAISSSSTDNAIPTAKTVYTYAVAKTANANKVYGTDGSGNALQYTATGTYTTTASNQLLTRAGAYDMYTTLSSCANHSDQDVTITMTALENNFVFAQKQWARRIAKNVYAICFEMYRNASSAAGTEVRVNNSKNFKVNGSNVGVAALSAISVSDSSPIGCTYNGNTFFINPTRALGSGNTYIIRITGIVYTV